MTLSVDPSASSLLVIFIVGQLRFHLEVTTNMLDFRSRGSSNRRVAK
jgi:hypothetical protein